MASWSPLFVGPSKQIENPCNDGHIWNGRYRPSRIIPHISCKLFPEVDDPSMNMLVAVGNELPEMVVHVHLDEISSGVKKDLIQRLKISELK